MLLMFLLSSLYNRCVLEAEWPAHSGSSQLLWNKLRNVVMGAAHFRWAAKRKSTRKMSASTEGGSSLLDPTDRAASRSSLDSHEAVQNDTFMEKFRKLGSIVKGSLNGLEQSGNTSMEDVNVTEEQTDKSISTDFIANPDSPSEYRILSRSESAGDANIIDKIHNNTRKTCSRTLEFDGEENSPTK